MTSSDPRLLATAASRGRGRVARAPLLAGVAVLCAVWAVAGYAADARARSAAAGFARTFSMEERRPDEVLTMRLEPSADGAAAAMASAALDDALGAQPPADSSPEIRQLWTRAAERLDEEIAAATVLVSSAVARRPGWPQHALLLGELAYVAQGRPAGAGADARRWTLPLRSVVASAPGLGSAWTFLAGGYLERWPALDPALRDDAPRALAQAFHDPDFVSRGFPASVTAIGRDAAAKLLPDELKPLRAAALTLVSRGDVAAAAALIPRIEASARKERAAGLARIEELVRIGDLESARSASQIWAEDFPPPQFDDAAGRRQTARVLELWPTLVAGSWNSDPRAKLAQFLLLRREKDADRILPATLDGLSDVPEVVRARVLLRAGREEDALALARRSAAASAFEWTPFYLDLARARLDRGNATAAVDALAQMPPSARDGCDALLLRRDVAAALGDQRETATAEERLGWVERQTYGADAWSPDGTLSICLVSGGTAPRKVRVAIEADGPTVVRSAWNAGELAPVLISGNRVIEVPLSGASGRHSLSVWADWGGPIRLGEITIEPLTAPGPDSSARPAQ